MKRLNSKTEVKQYIKQQKAKQLTIGFAPTMGALHRGHISLYEEARKHNDIVVSSIFVNPTQFNNPEDLEKYPRTVERDILQLENSGFVDAVYIPNIEDIYPTGLKSQKYQYDGLENEMEGAARPGHFDGVGTVIETLFNQIQPNNAYFGEKDFQQLKIIQKLVKNLNLPVKIHGVPIYRENNGLAMSSRNMRLSDFEKEQSLIINKTLDKVNEWFKTLSAYEIKKRVDSIFAKENGMTLEYFMIADEESLKEADVFHKNKNYRAFIVVNVGNVRLIDNKKLD